jgi:hypothetical protein
MLINSPNISGSLTVTGNTVITGSLTVLGGINATITGSATSASYVEYSNVANKPALVSGSAQVSFNGITDKPTLVSGSAQVSFNGITDKPTLVSGSSQITYSGISSIPSGIVSSSTQITGYNIFATTGSNQFNGSQAITGSLTVTGQVVAQTLNVQQVTSSIVYSSGSNVFGNTLGNTQQFTGSVSVTGSMAVNGASIFASSVTINTTNGAANYFKLFDGNVSFGATLGLGSGGDFVLSSVQDGTVFEAMRITRTTRAATLSGALNGTSAVFTSAPSIGGSQVQALSNSGTSTSFGVVLVQSVNGKAGYLTCGDNSATTWYGGQASFVTLGATLGAGMKFRVDADDTKGITIPTSGNVGIGTTSPSQQLSVKKVDNLTTAIASFAANNLTQQVEIWYAGVRAGGTSTDVDLYLSSKNAGAVVCETNGTERMRINQYGQLLINATSSTYSTNLYGYNLGVRGNTNQTFISIARANQNLDSQGMIIGLDTTIASILVHDNIPLKFLTNATERMRIASDGKVTITAPAHNQLTIQDSDAKLELGADDNTMIGIGMVTAGDGITWFTGRHRPGSAGIYDEMNVARLSGSWVNLFRIYSNGNWDFAGSDVSDVRLKENIKTIDYNATEKLIQLVPKSYNMIEHPTISKSGFIAQEVKEILPNFVTGNESENEYLGVDYNGILALAVKAIQEQQAQIEILKTKIEILEQS